MNRRSFVAGLGAVGAGGGVAMGTGAFSSVEAERDVSINVADDSSAYLTLKPGNENGGYVTETDGTLDVDLTGSNDNVDGEGINVNAITGMGDVFRIQNQGTESIEVQVDPLLFFDGEPLELLPYDGVLAVFMVPESPSGVDISLDFSWENWIDPELDDFISVISIGELDPGDEQRFALASVAFPENAVESVSIGDEFTVAAQEV